MTIEILALVDALGDLVRFLVRVVLLPGHRHDVQGVGYLIADIPCRMLLADEAFDVDRLRDELESRSIVALISPRANRKRVIFCDFAAYKRQRLVDDVFCSLKDLRRIGTRHDRTDTSFAAMIYAARSVLTLR